VIGLLVNPNNPNAEPDTKATEAAARVFGQKLLVVKAANDGEVEAAHGDRSREKRILLYRSQLRLPTGLSGLHRVCADGTGTWCLQVAKAVPGLRAGQADQPYDSKIVGDQNVQRNAVCAIKRCILTRRAALAVGITAIVQWFIIGSDLQTPSAAINSAAVSASLAIEHIQQTFQHTVDGLFTRATHSEALRQNYTRSIEAIKAQKPLPHVEGTVDIYPYQLSAIFGNNLRWSGRPVFLSFNAYTSELQAKNVAHLTGSTAPDTVFFTFAPLDNHLPALEDSQSLLKLLSTYRITALASPYVQMDRAPGPTNAQLREEEQRSMVVGWDQDIPVNNAAVMWANVDARPSLLGRLVLSAFKLPELEIELTLVDGSVVRDRFITSFGRSGFIVSPYLTTAVDLVYLMAGTSSAPRVQSFKLVPYLPKRMPTPVRLLVQFVQQHLWKSEIAVRLTPIKIIPQPTARALVVAQPSHQSNQ
jgi:hypothetical protein